MTPLQNQTCEACRADAPKVSDTELAELLQQIPDWQPIVEDGVLQLQRSWSFANFVEAMTFANQVAELAEQHGHHPALLVEWGKVTVRWWTHKIHGLHKTDFILAAKTDRILPH